MVDSDDARRGHSCGEMSEWLKEHAWKACVGVILLPRVRIPLSPPPSPADARTPGSLGGGPEFFLWMPGDFDGRGRGAEKTRHVWSEVAPVCGRSSRGPVSVVRVGRTCRHARCTDHGQRVQNSVFQCLLDLDQWVALRAKLLAIVNPQEDSLRFYFLGRNWKSRLEHHVYRPRILGQWFDGIRIYAAASSPPRSRRTRAGLR